MFCFFGGYGWGAGVGKGHGIFGGVKTAKDRER